MPIIATQKLINLMNIALQLSMRPLHLHPQLRLIVLYEDLLVPIAAMVVVVDGF